MLLFGQRSRPGTTLSLVITMHEGGIVWSSLQVIHNHLAGFERWCARCSLSERISAFRCCPTLLFSLIWGLIHAWRLTFVLSVHNSYLSITVSFKGRSLLQASQLLEGSSVRTSVPVRTFCKRHFQGVGRGFCSMTRLFMKGACVGTRINNFASLPDCTAHNGSVVNVSSEVCQKVFSAGKPLHTLFCPSAMQGQEHPLWGITGPSSLFNSRARSPLAVCSPILTTQETRGLKHKYKGWSCSGEGRKRQC